MAEHQARCPKCGEILSYDRGQAGTVGACVRCGCAFIYPAPMGETGAAGGSGGPPPGGTGQSGAGSSTGPGTAGEVGTAPPAGAGTTGPAPEPQRCRQCGGTSVGEPGFYCPFCGAPLAGEDLGITWEERRRRGFFAALLGTMRGVMFEPTWFFSRMPVTGELGGPLLFAVIVGSLGGWFWVLYKLLMRIFLIEMHSGRWVEPNWGAAVLMLVWAIVVPGVAALSVFIGAGVLHLSLMVVGGAQRGFVATFRTACYSLSPLVWVILPMCGGVIAAVWGVTCLIIGLRCAHATTGGKAALAVFLPAILCCTCCMGPLMVGAMLAMLAAR